MYSDLKATTEDHIDMRSDTVTRPSKKMRRAMATCAVGDDCYKDDPTVNRLEKEFATLFGKEAAIFTCSGTMGNLMAMMVHCPLKGEGALIGNMSHVYSIERGGMSAIGGVHPMVFQNKMDGTTDLEELDYMVPPNNLHLPQPRVICLESSHNLCGGRTLSP
jgi:threonine aldolase